MQKQGFRRFFVALFCALGASLWLSGCGDSSGGRQQQAETPESGLKIQFNPESGTVLKPGDSLEILAESNPGLEYFEIVDNPVLDCTPGQALGNFRRSFICKVLQEPVRRLVVTVKAQNALEEKSQEGVFPIEQSRPGRTGVFKES